METIVIMLAGGWLALEHQEGPEHRGKETCECPVDLLGKIGCCENGADYLWDCRGETV